MLCAHIKRISDYGYENFKHNIAKNYGLGSRKLNHLYVYELIESVGDISNETQLSTILSNIWENNSSTTVLKKGDSAFSSRLGNSISLEESVAYNIVTIYLLEYVKKIGADHYLETVEEPLEGNPLYIEVEGKRLSQDLLTSCINVHSLSKGRDLNKVSSILEIGCGFGRLAYLVQNLFDLKYIIVDIIPALFISQTHLTSVLKGKRIFQFREFSSFAEIKDEFEACDVIFLMPDQMRFLPDKIIDLFVSINCLQEVKTETVDYYFEQADRLAKHFYYNVDNYPPYKRHTDRENRFNPFKDEYYLFEEYPTKTNWDVVYQKGCDFPKSYSEIFYNIR